LANGPLRAQSKERYCSEYSATLKADVICRRYVGISLSAHPYWDVKQGGTADSVVLFVLGREYISVRGVFVYDKSSFDVRYKSREVFPVLRR